MISLYIGFKKHNKHIKEKETNQTRDLNAEHKLVLVRGEAMGGWMGEWG